MRTSAPPRIVSGQRLKTAFRNHGNLRGVVTVAGEYAIIAIALALASRYPSWWLYPLFVLVIGTRQYALAEIMTHEASHGNLCRSARLNAALGKLTSWPFLQTFAGYRRYHLDHHRLPLDDEDNNIYEEYDLWRLPEEDQHLSPGRAYWLFAGRPLSGVIGLFHAGAHLSDLYYDRDLRENSAMATAWLICLLCAWYFGFLGPLFLYWIVPQLYVLATLNYWSEVGDHYRVGDAQTRSDLNCYLNRLISHNIGYHALHHADPRIPWYLLPQAYRAHKDEIVEQRSSGYAQTLRQIVEFPAGQAVEVKA
jgi:fatty acid desaturase